jgi:hypothetical protein
MLLLRCVSVRFALANLRIAWIFQYEKSKPLL